MGGQFSIDINHVYVSAFGMEYANVSLCCAPIDKCLVKCLT